MIVEGYIREKGSQTLIQGATVTLTIGSGDQGSDSGVELATLRTGGGGFFRYEEPRVPAGETLIIHVEHQGYSSKRVFEEVADQVYVDIELDHGEPRQDSDPIPGDPTPRTLPPGTITISGRVRNRRTRRAIDNADVRLAVGPDEIAIAQTFKDDGRFKHEERPPTIVGIGKTLTIHVEHPGYLPWRRHLQVESDRVDVGNIDLIKPGIWERILAWWQALAWWYRIALAVIVALVIVLGAIYVIDSIGDDKDNTAENGLDQPDLACSHDSLDQLHRIVDEDQRLKDVLEIAQICLDEQDRQTRLRAVEMADRLGHTPSTLELGSYFDPLIEPPDLPRPPGDRTDVVKANAYYTRVTWDGGAVEVEKAKQLRNNLCDYLRGTRPDDATTIGCDIVLSCSSESLDQLQRIARETRRLESVLEVAQICLNQQNRETRLRAVELAHELRHAPSSLELGKRLDPQVPARNLPPAPGEGTDVSKAYAFYTRAMTGETAAEAQHLRNQLCDYLRGVRPDDATTLGCPPPPDPVPTVIVPEEPPSIGSPELAPPINPPEPVVEVDLNSLVERTPSYEFRLEGGSSYRFTRWKQARDLAATLEDFGTAQTIQDLPSMPGFLRSAPTLLGLDEDTRALFQEASDNVAKAWMVAEVVSEMFGVWLHSRSATRANFAPVFVSDSRRQWRFLTKHGARPSINSTTRRSGISTITLGGVDLSVAALQLNQGSPANRCLAFVGRERNKRIDGFLCRTSGPELSLADAGTALSRMRVPDFIEP